MTDIRGFKRVCASCATRFYDFNKSPILCPSCGVEFTGIVKVRTRRGRGVVDEAKARPEDDEAEDVVEDDADDDTTVSLSDLEEDEADDEDEDEADIDTDGDLDLDDLDDEDTDDEDFDDLDDEIDIEDEEKD